MANKFTFGAYESKGFGSGNFGGQKKEPENKSTGTGASRSPSVVYDDLNDDEKSVYKPLYQQKMRENPDDPNAAMLFAEDGLFTWQNNQKYFDQKGNLVSGQLNQQAAGRTPSIIYDNIQDKNDKQAYYLGYRNYLRKNPGDMMGAQIAGEDEIRRNHMTPDQQLAESMLGDLSMGSNAPLYLKDQNVIGDLLTMNGAGKEQVSKALPQYDFGIFKPKNQGPTDAAYAAAMLDRQEREQRDRDDAATGAGSRVQQIVAEKELERSLADGSIQNEQLRQQAESDLARVRNSNQDGEVFDQNGLAGLWSTIDAIRNQTPEVNGNVDLNNRKRISAQTMREAGYNDFDDNSYATLYSATYNGNGKTVLATPIDANGKVYSQGEIDDYVYDLLQNTGDANELIERDKIENGGRGLIISGVNGERKHNIDAMGRLGVALHEEQAEQGVQNDNPYTFSAADTNLYRSNMEAAQKKIRDEIAGGTMQPEELESAEADLAALSAYMDGTDTSAAAKENASAITEAWNKEAVDKRNPVESFLADIPQLIRESTLNNMYSIINALAGNTDAGKLNTPTLDKYTQAGRDAYNKVNDTMWGGVDAVTNAAYNFIKGVGSGMQSAVVGANALAKLFGFDAVNNALLGENAVDTTKSREYLTNQIQKGIVEPADKEAVRFKENLLPKITSVMTAFGMDKETAESAADIAMTYMGQSSEMVGRMVPSLVASWAAGGTGAGEAANIIGRLMNSWKTPGFLSLWLTSTGEAYQGAIDRNGENVTYGDALASLIGGFFDATIENYETKWGFSNGVQAIAGGRRFPRFSEMVGGIASETSEELKQLFSGDVWENFGDILSGRQLTHALNGDTEESLFYVAKYLDTAKDTVFTTLGMNTIIGAGNVAANMYQNAVQAVVDGNATPEQMEQAQQVAMMAAVAQEDQVKDATVTTPSTEEQHDMFEAGLAGGDQGAHSVVDGRAQAEVEIRNQQGTDNNRVDTDTDVRAAEQRMREAQAAEVQAIIASNSQTAQAEERARLEQEARDAIERRKLAEAEYQRAQAAAGAAVSNQNEQVNLRNQEEEQARTAQEKAAKYEMRLRQAQENLARAEEAARQQGLQAKDRKEAEKQAGIARRQLRRAQEAYNNAMKAVEDQNRQADARKEAEEAAWNSIDERNRALQTQYDQTNQNAAGVIADQNQQATDRAQLEQDARIAEMRMQEARAAEVQAIIASNSQTEQAEERQRLAQEAQDAIARRKAAEEEYQRARAAADAAVQGQNAQADERSAREDEANRNRENLDDITRRIDEAGTQDNIQLTPEQVQEIINGYQDSEETEGYEGEEEKEEGGEGTAEGKPEAEGQTSAGQEPKEEEAGGNEENQGADEEDRRGEGAAEGQPEAQGQTSEEKREQEEAGGAEGSQGTDVQEETRRGEGAASSEQETEGQASAGKEIREEGENAGSQGTSAPQENRNNGEGSAQGEQETGGEISEQQVTQEETGENDGNVGAAEETDEESQQAGEGEAQGRQEAAGETSAEQPVQQQEESEETAGNEGLNTADNNENTAGTGEAAGNNTQNTNGEINEEQRKADEINRTFGFNQRSTDGNTSYKPGLTVSSWKGELSDQTRTELQVIHEYAKEHGFSVVMDSTLRTNKVKGVVNGFYAKDEGGGRVIHLAQDGMAPLRTTLGHELYHMISNLNRNGAQQMERLYRDYASRMGIDVEELIDKKLKSYKDLLDKDAQKARAQALEEVIADSMYDVIGDERTLRVLAMEDRGMAERIRDWADRVLRDIRRLIDRYGSNKAEARVLHEQADAMENMRAAIERVLAETKELQDAKKAARSLGSNSQMLNDYHQMMDTATTREEMNAATLALAGQVLENGGIEANWDNMRTLMTAALDYASGGGVISQVLNAYDMNTWIPSDEANRAFVSMGRYIKQMLESQDEAGYMQLMGMEPEADATARVENDLTATRDEREIKNRKGETLADIDQNGTAVKYSQESWEATDKDQVRKDLIAAGYDKESVGKWIDDVNSIAKIIIDNKDRLDYTADQEMHFVKPNAEYKITIDASTLCAKRRLYQGIFDQIQKQLPNTALQPGDLTKLINMMNEKGLETPCSFCYVESRRKWLGRYAKRFLKKYEGEYKPSMEQLTSTTGLAQLRREHRQAYDDFIADMNKKGTANPKVVQPRTDYRSRELLDLTPKTVEKILRMGGVRVQSFSDFETVHLIDMMQVMLDMSAMKLTAQAYTKVPNFAWVFGGTGMKINLSLVGLGTGLDENGKLVFDSKEGINYDEAMKLREKYPQNVGTILVGINDAHILAAMADDRIDFIIPFHTSGWNKTDLKLNTLVQNYDTKYQSLQNERYFVKDAKGKYVKYANGKYVSTKISEGNLYPIDYWDYSKTGKENAERYLQLCAEQNRIPKFYNFLVDNQNGSFSLQPDGSTDGYWKLLIDFKMYDNNGVGAPQTAVKPIFNMKEANRVLNEYDGNPNELPYDQEIVDKFVEDYKANHRNVQYSVSTDDDIKYSLATDVADQVYMRAVYNGNEKLQRKMIDQAAKNDGFTTEDAYHGSEDFGFTEFDLKRGQNTIFVAYNKTTAETYGNNLEERTVSDKKRSNIYKLRYGTKEEMVNVVNEVNKGKDYYKNVAAYTSDKELENTLRERAKVALQGIGQKATEDIRKIIDKGFDNLGKMSLTESYEWGKKARNALNKLMDEVDDQTGASVGKLINVCKEIGVLTYWYNKGNRYIEMDGFSEPYLFTVETYLERMASEDSYYEEDLLDYYDYVQKTLSGGGIYKLYTRPGNQLVVDAHGNNWNRIEPEWDHSGKEWTTREIAEYAKKHGYTSVRINDVYDHGGKAHQGIHEAGHGDIGIFFNEKDVKSADLVTYDNAGNIIPPTQRFTDSKDIRWSVDNGDDRTRYAVDPDDARDMLDLGSDIARTSDAGWQVIDTMRQMKLRQTQNEDGAVQQTPGYWKKQVPEIAKSLKEYTYGKDQKTIEKAVKELYADLDSYQGDARGFVDYALREAQGTMRDLYTDERENPTRDNLKAFFDKYGPLYVTEEQKKELRYYAGGMTEFRRQAAGLVPITNKKSGIGLEEVWEELAPLIGKDPSIVSVGTMIMEFNDAIEKARSVNGEERTLTDEEMAMLDRRALDLVAEYMEAGATVVPTRSVEKIDADKHQQALKEVSRLQDETEKQNAEIERLNKKLEDADNVNQSLNRQLFDQAKVVDQLKKSNATRAEVEEARAAYRDIAAQSAEAVKAMKDLQKKLETVRQRRDEYRRQLAQAHRAEQQYEKAQHQIERLQAGRDSLKKQIEQMKLKAMDTRLIARQTRERNKALTNIRKKGGELRAMFASPSEKKGYIPMDQVRAAADLVESLVDAEKGGSAAKMSKRLENALRDARESNDYQTSVMYDEGLYHDMQDVTRLLEDKGSLRNLSNSELNFVEGTLTSIVHQIKTSNETVGRQKNQALQDEAEGAIRVMKENPRELNGIGRLIRKFGLTQLNAQRYFSIMGHHGNNAWSRMDEDLSDGQRKSNMLTMNMTKTFEGLTQGENEKKFDKFTGKNAVWHDTGIHILKETGEDSGRTWKMNGAMRSFFGLSWMSEENREAMRAVGEKSEGGGDLYQLTIPDEELMKKGKEKEAYARGERVYFTAQDAERIMGEMTDYEKAWMNAWRNMEKLSKNAINETSLQLNGFRKANVSNYVPIFRDPRYIGKEFESVVTDARLTSMGFLKERVNAHNPMMLMDLTNVINRQVRDVSAYYGFAIPVRNATRIYNGKMPGNTTSVKEVINKTQGMEFGQYFEKLMTDLQGGNRVESSFLDKLRGNVAGATLAGNPSVIIKQAASYPAAASVLGWGPLLKGLKYFNPASLKKIDVNEIDKYTSALWERRSRSLSDLEANANRNTAMSKFLHKMTNGIQGMDIATTKVIWKAAEYYVDEHSPDLKRGTEEYNNAVARIYEQALEGTQPEYGTMQRPQILRSTNQLVKSLTMYKTQSLQNFGILVDAATNLSDKAKADKAKSTPETQEALRMAKRQMATALSSQITSAVILGVMTAVGKALLHKLGGYRDDKGDLTVESVGGQILKDSVSSVAGMVAGGSELFDMINGLIEGQSPFDIEAAGVSTINDLYQNTYAFLDAMKVLGDSDLSDAQKMSQMWPKLRKLGMSIALLKGKPANNFLNLLDGIAANAADFATGKAGTFASQSPLQIAGTALIGSAQGRETSNKAVAGYIAQAMMEGRQAEAVRLYNEQLRQGKTADALNTAIATWQKQNIPQIREAAEAIDSGDLVGYNQKINQLVEMGLSMTNAVKYVEAVRKKNEKKEGNSQQEAGSRNYSYDEIVSGMTKATATSEENSYTNGMMNSLLEDNNIEAAKAIRDDMIKNGKKSSAINSSLTSHWKPLLQAAYANGDMAEVRRITNMLVSMGMKRTTVAGWATSGSSTSSSSSSKKTGFGSGSFGSGGFGSSNKKTTSSSKKKTTTKKTGFGSGSFGSGTFGK